MIRLAFPNCLLNQLGPHHFVSPRTTNRFIDARSGRIDEPQQQQSFGIRTTGDWHSTLD